MSKTIYQELWDIDQQNGGCKVGTRCAPAKNDQDGANAPPSPADIELDLQLSCSGQRQLDLATRPLFARWDPTILERPTYRAFVSLLDNYIVNYTEPEEESRVERSEIDAFLGAILDTAVMKRAIDYIGGELRQARLTQSKEALAAELYRLWFETYTNYYKGRSSTCCSAFEHVFVGEGKYQPHYGIAETLGEVSGYHSWIKFLLDEQSGRVNYLGYKYDVRGHEGPQNPNVVTLQMVWYHQDLAGRVHAELWKKIGGFFVGTSPELDFAMGTVAFFESTVGVFASDKRRASINGATYDLVLYRNVEEDGRRGSRIRSFYPEFLGNEVADEQPAPMDRVQVRLVPPSRIYTPGQAPAEAQRGPLVIAAVLPSTHGHPGGVGRAPTQGYIELRNQGTAPIDLADPIGWELRDQRGRPLPLAVVGSLAPGESRRVMLSTHAAAPGGADEIPSPGQGPSPAQALHTEPAHRPDQNGMHCTPRGGAILLYRGTELISSVSYQRVAPGELVRFLPFPP